MYLGIYSQENNKTNKQKTKQNKTKQKLKKKKGKKECVEQDQNPAPLPLVATSLNH